MRKNILAITIVLVVSLVCTAFAMEAPASETTVPSTDVVTPAPSETDAVKNETTATIPDTYMEEVKQETVSHQTMQEIISDEPVTDEDMKTLCFFDTEKENALCFAASGVNCIVKAVQGTVTVVSTNELQVNVPELNNDFCFMCAEPFTQQLGDTVTVWLVIQVTN